MIPFRISPVFLTLPLLACAPTPTPPKTETFTAIQAAGLHNVFRITDSLYSGSSPEGDEGFRSLKDLGIKTIISVDGASPDVAMAHKYGMRYVHLPVGYDGIPAEQGLRLARAAQDVPKPIYMHCHHGKHRGPAAAAILHLCMDDRCTIETAVEEMRRAGTDPRYVGLYEAPRQFQRPSSTELKKVSGDFPETVPPEGLAKLMVSIDERWDNLKRLRANRWQPDPAHPDIEPAHEALQLLENGREAQRLPDAEKRPPEFRQALADFTAAAGDLEASLRSSKNPAMDAEGPFNRIQKACSQCHSRFRDMKGK